MTARASDQSAIATGRTGARHKAAGQAAGERRYFLFKPTMNIKTTARPVWVNELELCKEWAASVRKPFSNLHFSDVPLIAFDRRGRRGGLLDAYPETTGWIVSDRLKALLEGLDPEGFAFVRAEVAYNDFASPGPGYWFADIVRWLDCIDEENSVIKYQDNIPFKNYLRLYKAKMRPEAVGSAHAFRLVHSPHEQIADDIIAKAIRAGKIRGFGLISLPG